MSASLSLNRTKCIYAWAIVILAGCAGTPSTQPASSALVLSDHIILENKGDVEGLYRSWIAPHNVRGYVYQNTKYGYILHANKVARYKTEDAIREGFGRFCLTSGGILKHIVLTDSVGRSSTGDRYICATPNGVFVGEFITQKSGNNLEVFFDSPALVKLRETHEARKAQNGPTGVVVTDEGRFKFLRIGNLKERHVFQVGLGRRSDEYVPVEEMEKIEFHKNCCDVDVTLRDGRTASVNQSNLRERKLDSVSTYGVGEHGFPLVLIDSESGQPYTRIFSNFEGIKAIFFDDASIWKEKPADVISTQFDTFSIEKYIQKLRAEANLLYAEATNNGWIKLLPDGKLTPQLLNHLEMRLRTISGDSACGGNAVVGVTHVTSLESRLRCQVAARELNLVIGGGYSLVTDVTPLSSIIVLSRIKEDLRTL